jgi:protein-S-isoprenylcysteine O-methyltransferase Ste14
MKRSTSAIGSSVFFLIAPGVVAGVVPWWLTRWRAGELVASAPGWAAWAGRITGLFLLVPATVVLVHAFARFVIEGAGTPAPIAPTRRLVVGGLYRHVRNPMYLAVLAIILGQAILLGRPVLLGYAAAVAAAVVAFVRWYEEPTLARAYGAEYEAYRAAVRGWWPRIRPWQPDVAGVPVVPHDRGAC